MTELIKWLKKNVKIICIIIFFVFLYSCFIKKYKDMEVDYVVAPKDNPAESGEEVLRSS
jgi:hypothetical protein